MRFVGWCIDMAHQEQSEEGGVLLLAGGVADPQIEHLRQRAAARGVRVRSLLHGPDQPPLIDWCINTDCLEVNGSALTFSAAFIRQDVFRALKTKSKLDHSTARSWKTLLDGWLWTHPKVRIFNRNFLMRDEVNKPLALVWAREAGLAIPKSRITDSATKMLSWLEEEPIVYKPVAGGDLARELDKAALDRNAKDHLPRPYTFQQRLVAPELRIFRVGDSFHAFEVVSEKLDYRADDGKPRLRPIEPPPHLVGPLKKLTDRIGLNWTAADFKTCATTGKLLFLETNSNPMFVAFDKACNGALTASMIDWLTALRSAS